MQYMILIYEPAGCYDSPEGQAALGGIVARHMALAGDLRAAGAMVNGDGLQGVETATTVVTGEAGQQSLHDGPFAETREHLGGYYLIDVADLDAALAMAKRVPVMPGGKVEIRPVAVY